MLLLDMTLFLNLQLTHARVLLLLKLCLLFLQVAEIRWWYDEMRRLSLSFERYLVVIPKTRVVSCRIEDVHYVVFRLKVETP